MSLLTYDFMIRALLGAVIDGLAALGRGHVPRAAAARPDG